MKQLLNRTLLILAVFFFAATTAMADTPQYKFYKHTSNDGGIYEKISADGKWALVNLGMTQGGTGDQCPSQMVNTANGDMFPVLFNGRNLNIRAISNEDANGKVTIVGSLLGRPMSYYFDPKNPTTPGTITIYTLTADWSSGELVSVTPDGKYAVGQQAGYSGKDLAGAELGSDYWFNTLYVEIGKQQPIATPGAPKYDRHGHDQHAIKFEAISADGRYVLGEREWFMPTDGFPFIYDTQTDTYKPIGFTTQGNQQITSQGIVFLDFPTMSTSGRYVGALAALVPEGDAIATSNYLCRYDVQTGELTIFNDTESANVSVGCIDDQGTIFGLPESGGPLRNFKILYKDKYWVSFSQICQQLYGFNFSQKLGYEFTGTPSSVTADGTAFVGFSDPQGESYYFNFGCTVEEACSGIDLLKNYTVTPEAGASFSKFKNIEVNFGRSVQVIGKGNTHFHLYNKKTGAKVADGLSTASGIALKQNSNTTVVFSVRNVTLEDGVEYEVVIDKGAVALANDADMSNGEIRITYIGRKDSPVTITKTTPEDGSKLNLLDPSTSYILLTFDTRVQLTENYEAYVERLEEGGNKTRLTTLTLATGNTDATKNQLLMYPTSTLYLYDGIQYKVTLSAGSVSDYSGSETSYNNEWSATYNGAYVREVATETTMFIDDFNDPNVSLGKWLQYEGDHKTPQSEMQGWGFDADNTPWNFSTRDTEDSGDYFASSHSLYAPSGKSDDWMMTPQLKVPEDGKAVVEFDAQKYRASKNDHLLVYVIPFERNVSYLNDANMSVLKQEAKLLADIEPSAGGNDNLTKGEWTHYTYPLADYANKDIYIAFVNQNDNQSAIFVDNVVVRKEILFTIGFSNEDRFTNKDNVTIAGNFTVKNKDFKSGSITLILKDAEGNEVSRVGWPSVSGAIVDRAIPFSFSTPLPLAMGKANKYSIDVVFDGTDIYDAPYQRTETYQSEILNLAFTPTKRVVLEEMTGTTCPNCPQGHIAIEACERQFKDQFIPISIHSYDNDDLGANFLGYSLFLGLNGAPIARINRITDPVSGGIYLPMYGIGNAVYYDMPEQNLWYNIVAQELDKLALCDIDATATYTADKKQFVVNTNVKYALDAEQIVSVFAVLLEDGIVSFQENNFAQSDATGLGEWGVGGIYGQYYAYPVTHNDVVRAVYGDTFAGSIGLLPQQFKAGEVYNTQLKCKTSDALSDTSKAKVVVMIIDTQTGEVINAVKTAISEGTGDGIESVSNDINANSAVYNASGLRMHNTSLPAGLYIQNGKKFVVK